MTTSAKTGGGRWGTARRTWTRNLLAAAAVAAAAGVAVAADPPAGGWVVVPPPAVLPPLDALKSPVPGQQPVLVQARMQAPAGAAAPVAQPPVVAQPPAAAGQPPAAPPPNGLDPTRNPLLAAPPPGMLGAAPPVTAAAQQKVGRLVSKVIDPETTLDLVVGQTRVLVLKGTPFRIQSGDEKYFAFNVANQKELLVQGKKVGTTVLNIWFGEKDDPTKQETLTYLVRVYPDPEAKARLEAAYKALEKEINAYFKECDVRLKLVGDKLAVSGKVRDFVQGGQILRVIRANMGDAAGAAGVPYTAPPVVGADPTAAIPSPALESFIAAGGANIINLLEVPGEQQVQLRVIVAEVNRAAARSIGMNFGVTNNRGVTVFRNNTGGIVGNSGFNSGGGGGFGNGGGSGFGTGTGGTIANITAALDGGRIPLAINALRTLDYARSLAEPTLVTLNGQPANFLAGGQFPVPVVSGATLNGLQGVSYVPYGVQLNFTPFITDRDRIRLNVSANVSSRDIGSGTSIGGSSVAGLNTRNFNSTVELRAGETLAVAGLIETNLASNATRVPFFGDLPYLGPLLGSQKIEAGEKELVIFITPELVRPMDAGQLPPLPGSEIIEPSDFEFYMLTRIEGHCRDFRSPIRTDRSRIRQYQLLESAYIAGPSGYSAWPNP